MSKGKSPANAELTDGTEVVEGSEEGDGTIGMESEGNKVVGEMVIGDETGDPVGDPVVGCREGEIVGLAVTG